MRQWKDWVIIFLKIKNIFFKHKKTFSDFQFTALFLLYKVILACNWCFEFNLALYDLKITKNSVFFFFLLINFFFLYIHIIQGVSPLACYFNIFDIFDLGSIIPIISIIIIIILKTYYHYILSRCFHKHKRILSIKLA